MLKERNNKRGWIRILEATIAVMIVMGVLVSIYSSSPNTSSLEDLIVLNHEKILGDIQINKTLRLKALEVSLNETTNISNFDDPNYIFLNDYVNSSLVDSIGYYFVICSFDSISCKLSKDYVVETLDRDVYAKEIILSSELIGGNPVYSPRKVKLFLWEKIGV